MSDGKSLVDDIAMATIKKAINEHWEELRYLSNLPITYWVELVENYYGSNMDLFKGQTRSALIDQIADKCFKIFSQKFVQFMRECRQHERKIKVQYFDL